MTCEELGLEYGAYALGISQDPEHCEIGEHLNRGCDACRKGVGSARSTVAAISGMVDLVDPPSRLRKRVLMMVHPEVGNRQWFTIWLPWLAASVMGVVLAFSVFRPAPVTPVNPDLARLEQAMSILNDPTTQDVSFGEPTARGRVFVSANKGVVFIAAHLPKLEAGKTFELWVIPGKGNPIPAGTFNSAADASAIHVRPGPVEGAVAVAVTVEPAGGSMQPTSTPFIVTKL